MPTPLTGTGSQINYPQGTAVTEDGTKIVYTADPGFTYVADLAVTLDTRLDAIGIAQETQTTGNPGSVALLGSVSAANTGLTPGVRQYIRGNATLDEDPNALEELRLFPIGRATSATNVVLSG